MGPAEEIGCRSAHLSGRVMRLSGAVICHQSLADKFDAEVVETWMTSIRRYHEQIWEALGTRH